MLHTTIQPSIVNFSTLVMYYVYLVGIFTKKEALLANYLTVYNMLNNTPVASTVAAYHSRTCDG